MKKLTLALAIIAGFSLSGCSNSDLFSGDVYTAEQAKEARSITYGTILSARPVKVQGDSAGVVGTVGGGVLGGVAGSAIGGGTGQAIATTIGAIAGAAAGSVIEQKASQVNSLEMVIKKDDGQQIVVVQKYDEKLTRPGTRVRIVGGSKLNVSAL